MLHLCRRCGIFYKDASKVIPSFVSGKIGQNVTNRILSEHRLHDAFSTLKKAIRGNGFTVTDAEKALGLSKRSVSLILSELVKEDLIVRTGRGTYAFYEKPSPMVSPETLTDDSSKLYRSLKDQGIQFALSCLDILVDYTHLILRRYPHFCWVLTGSEDWAMEVLEGVGFHPLRDPNSDQLTIALDLTLANELAVIRKTTIFYAADDGLASVERALVDLHYEVTRGRYPLDAAELIRVYYSALTTVSLEYPKMLRYAGLRRFRSEIEWVLWNFKDRIDIPESYIQKPTSTSRFIRQLPSFEDALR
jgi:DNA-binding transcriptional ArsR family regulator